MMMRRVALSGKAASARSRATIASHLGGSRTAVALSDPPSDAVRHAAVRDQGPEAGRIAAGRAHHAHAVEALIGEDVFEQHGAVPRIRLEGDGEDIAGTVRRRLQREEAPMSADIDERIAGAQGRFEKVAGDTVEA